MLFFNSGQRVHKVVFAKLAGFSCKVNQKGLIFRSFVKRGVKEGLCSIVVDHSSIVGILGLVHGTDQLNVPKFLKAKSSLPPSQIRIII